jgi:murein DD-endopeptidase MepM/ murein hydrolase activator NlpD
MQGLPLKTDIIALNFKIYRLYVKVFSLLTLLAILAIGIAFYYPDSKLQYPNAIPTTNNLEETKITIRSGDTLGSILSLFSISEQEINQIIDITSTIYDLRKLQIGQVLRVYYTMEDDYKILQSISLKLDAERKIEIYRDDETFKLKEIFIPLTKNIVKLSATIDSSIFGAAKKAGIPEKAIIEAINAYSYSVDFQRDIQPNDTLNILLETFNTEDGKLSHHGKVLFSSLNLSGVEHKIYRYTLQDGSDEFISDDYTTMRRSLLKTPIPVTKISSKFGMRKHPILGYSKMHTGIDFAAPIGTPIYAAGNGVVEEIGIKGAYGKYIRIRHNGELSTAYAHARSFASGLKKGSAIKQGQIIAYVGTTGRSTGPHLHYEVLVKGKHINPLSIKSIPVKKLTGKELANFKNHKKTVEQALAKNGDHIILASNNLHN